MSPYSLDHISLRSYVLEPRAGLLTARGISTRPQQRTPSRESAHADPVFHGTLPRPVRGGLQAPTSDRRTTHRHPFRRQRVVSSSAFPFPRIVKEHPGANHAAVRPLRGDNGIRTHDPRLAKPPL